YIVGLNQLQDVSIDKINKPHLPVAAGEFSYRQGQWIVAVCGLLALLISGIFGKWLFATVAISLLIGTAYSLPPIRLKRFPFFAAFCIFTVRGVIVNLGLFLYFSQQFSEQEFIAPAVWALTAFVVVFTVAIAIFKDVPDMDGDKQYNITTFTILLGKETVFNLSRWIITISYLGMIVAAVFWLPTVNPWYLGISHLGLLFLLWWRSEQVNLSQKPEIARFYQFIWKLFFLEYLLFPVACFLG
ncbi:MAG: homogentisate phytyltransferase, partial [Halothece sp.]